MKKFVSYILALIMAASSVIGVCASSTNTAGNLLEVKKNTVLCENGSPKTLTIQPRNGVESGDSIILTVENGDFNLNLVEDETIRLSDLTSEGIDADGLTDGQYNPFLFRAEYNGETFEQIMANQLPDIYDTLRYYVGNRNSRQLPYSLEYVSSDTIKVNLFPIPDNYVNQDNSDITQGTPVYAIKLPLVSGETGYTEIAVDGQQSTIKSGGWYTAARVNTGADFSKSLDSSMKIEVSAKTSVKTNRVILKGGEPITLNITPLVGISDGESILIHINNASFNRHLTEDERINLSDLTSDGIDTFGLTHGLYDSFLFRAEMGGEGYEYIVANQQATVYDTLCQFVGDRLSRQLPYGLEYVSPDTIKVNLFPIPDSYVNRNNSDITQGIPIYSIALPAVAGGSTGEVTIDLDGGSSGIPSFGNYAVANVYDDTAGTNAYVLSSDIIVTSNDTICVPKIKINENESDIFKAGQVSITAPEGYKFDRSHQPIIMAGSNASFDDVIGSYSEDNKTVIFDITNYMRERMDSSKRCSIIVSNLVVYTSDDNNFGDINLTVSGAEAGVTEQTFKVAERKPYGLETTTVTTAEATEITTADTAETTETTTAVVSVNSGGSGGGGGGGSRSIIKTTATTTEITTETTTETTTEAVTEEASETTTETAINSDIKVTIGSKKFSVGNEVYNMDAEPYIQAGSNSTMVPLRFVAIAVLGDNVENADTSELIQWDADTKTAAILLENMTIKFTAGSSNIIIGSNVVPMDYGVKAEIKDDRMYIPFRALGNALGANVDWNGDTKTAAFMIK